MSPQIPKGVPVKNIPLSPPFPATLPFPRSWLPFIRPARGFVAQHPLMRLHDIIDKEVLMRPRSPPPVFQR